MNSYVYRNNEQALTVLKKHVPNWHSRKIRRTRKGPFTCYCPEVLGKVNRQLLSPYVLDPVPSVLHALFITYIHNHSVRDGTVYSCSKNRPQSHEDLG